MCQEIKRQYRKVTRKRKYKIKTCKNNCKEIRGTKKGVDKGKTTTRVVFVRSKNNVTKNKVLKRK